MTVGSSPLTRGKLAVGYVDFVGCGLIPAHAGKTRSIFLRPGTTQAHPRSRGENGAFGRARSCTTGSSPLTRGKLRGGGTSASLCGLIPAHAGKT